MPRNRKRQPPVDPVAARMTPLTPTDHGPLGTRWDVSCGRCGQHLLDFKVFLIKHGPGTPVFGWSALPLQTPGEPLRTITSEAGWRKDGDLWRPTNEHLTRRQQARAVASDGTATQVQLARLAHGVFHRSGMRPKHRLSDHGRQVLTNEDYRLPANFQCPRCDAVNIADVATDIPTSAKLTT